MGIRCKMRAIPKTTNNQRMSKNKSKRVHVGEGVPCARCGQPSEKYTHAEGWKPKPGRAYLRVWYRCANPDCPTTQFNLSEDYIRAASTDEADEVKLPTFDEAVNLVRELEHRTYQIWRRTHDCCMELAKENEELREELAQMRANRQNSH